MNLTTTSLGRNSASSFVSSLYLMTLSSVPKAALGPQGDDVSGSDFKVEKKISLPYLLQMSYAGCL